MTTDPFTPLGDATARIVARLSRQMENPREAKMFWDLFSNGQWIGMAEGDTPQEAIQMAKRCLPERVKRNEQLMVRQYDPSKLSRHQLGD